MEVVKSNFMKVLPLLEDVFKRSVFIAVDTEFTGLSVHPNDQPSFFDSLSERYSNVRNTASRYMICQIGLSAYLKDSTDNGYVAHSFNFYLFPKEQGKHQPRFRIQASNMEFLCQHDFDFNKWIYEGIPYCNAKEEDLVMFGLNAAIGKNCTNSQWIEAVGFRHVFNLLVQAKKPILGHNLLFDIAYIFEKFHMPLPRSYDEFKKEVHSLFPTIIDTKTICLEIKKDLDDGKLINNTSLEDVYELVKSQQFSFRTLYTPLIKHSDESKNYKNSRSFHEAGFDAYCVGVVFLRLAHFLSMKGVKSTEATPIHFNQYMRNMQPYLNKINLPRGPLSFINLAGPDLVCKRRGLLVLKTIDGSALDIEKIKSKCDGSIDIQLLQADHALVAVVSVTKAQDVFNHLIKNDLHQVRHYNWFKDTPKTQLITRGLKAMVFPTIGSLLLVVSLYQIWKTYIL